MKLLPTTPVTRLIELQATPQIENGFVIKKHLGRGFIELSINMELYISTIQKADCCTLAKIEPEIKEKIFLNATVLDYLLANKEIIPKEWKKITILFPGTEYATENGEYVFVRCLYWSGANWCSSKHQVGAIVNDHTYIAITNLVA
jgi:hypothetical protein